ncbi:hypothetical protein PTKIN_Ptkin12aG0062100 [Pterospermum kingtungense]
MNRYGAQDKGRPLPKFGEWDVNDPSSAEGFTVIFNKARNEKKTGGKVESPGKNDPTDKQGAVLGKPQSINEVALKKALFIYIEPLRMIQRTGACIRSYDKSCWNLFGCYFELW